MRWEKWDYLSMAYCLSNKYTENYCNRTILVQVIVEDVVVYFFLRHGVVCWSSFRIYDSRKLSFFHPICMTYWCVISAVDILMDTYIVSYCRLNSRLSRRLFSRVNCTLHRVYSSIINVHLQLSDNCLESSLNNFVFCLTSFRLISFRLYFKYPYSVRYI